MASDCVIPTHGKDTMDIGLEVLLLVGTYHWKAPRSGITIWNFIDVGAGIVDSDFWGEMKVILFNHYTDDFLVKAGD